MVIVPEKKPDSNSTYYIFTLSEEMGDEIKLEHRYIVTKNNQVVINTEDCEKAWKIYEDIM